MSVGGDHSKTVSLDDNSKNEPFASMPFDVNLVVSCRLWFFGSTIYWFPTDRKECGRKLLLPVDLSCKSVAMFDPRKGLPVTGPTGPIRINPSHVSRCECGKLM
jgi:hypothetical protein